MCEKTAMILILEYFPSPIIYYLAVSPWKVISSASIDTNKLKFYSVH